MRKVLVVVAAALGKDLLVRFGVRQLAGAPVHGVQSAFPAVTCVAQATLRTGLPVAGHGMPANGRFFRETASCAFWNQSAGLVAGARIWEAFRARGGRVGLYFFQQSLGEAVDEIVSPAPIHTHGGGLIMATYQQPAGVLGVENPVPLWRYWGPLASPKVGWGIVRAMEGRLARGDAPEALFVYLPTLDYDLQRAGVQGRRAAASVQMGVAQIERLAGAARAQGYEVVVVGDYAIEDVSGGVAFPSRVLREAGLFATRSVRGMAYPDFYRSRAVAVCDHQVALIYCREAACREQVRALLAALPEVERVEPGAGEVDWVVTARAGCWFSWQWWREAREAPDYATHVDIHNKPGFDACELFFGRTPFRVSGDVRRVRGTHGRQSEVALASTVPLAGARDLAGVAQGLRAWLGE